MCGGGGGGGVCVAGEGGGGGGGGGGESHQPLVDPVHMVVHQTASKLISQLTRLNVAC